MGAVIEYGDKNRRNKIMDYNIQFSYENQNQNSYLMATIPPLKKVIEYQLQMMTSNEIPGLLTSMKRQSNENILKAC